MNFRKASIFQRDTEKPEEQNDSGGMLAVWGSPGSGKTITAVKIAKMLSARKKNVILLLCDMAAPMLPCICPADALESKGSLAGVLAAARISENLIKHNLVTFKRNSCLAVLGLLERQNEYSTPPFTQKQVVELLDGLRQIAPYVIVDCGSYIANDILSAVALMEADSMYLIENHHEGIVSREKYNAVQAEMARRKAAKSPSKRAPTGLSAYTSRYALSDRLVCGECGTLYRRCTWTRPDGKRVVWRCVSRLDYGKKYCHSSPTLDEVPLQQAIIAALNTVLPDLDGRIRQITEALEAEVIPFPGSGMSLGDIDRRLAELEAQFQRLLEKAADDPIAYGDQFKEILDEQTALKELRASILAENKEHAEADRRIRDAAGMLENAVPHIAEWDESAIRQLVAQVKVLSKNEICVTLKSGIEIRQSISD